MKKKTNLMKLITIITLVSMFGCLVVGCGKKEVAAPAEVEEAVEEVTEAPVAEVENETTLGYIKEDSASNDQEETVEKEPVEFTADLGMEKVAKLFTAYNDLLNTKDVATLDWLYTAQTMSMGIAGVTCDISTSDGLSLDYDKSDMSGINPDFCR